MRDELLKSFVGVVIVVSFVLGVEKKISANELLIVQKNNVVFENQLMEAKRVYLNAYKAKLNEDLSNANELFIQAFYLFLPLAERGIDEAQLKIGLMNEKGFGVPQDFAKATEWYSKAAEQNNPYAQRSLGKSYEKGLGVNRDYEEAIRWYLKASQQGYWSAQVDLAEMYEKGLGTPKNFVSAYAWYDVALPLLPEDRLREYIIGIRDEMAKKMTSDQIMDAKELSQEWSKRLPEDKPL